MLTGGALRPYYAVVAAAFKERVEADGGTVESMSCLKQDLKVLNPIKPPAFTGLLNEYSGAAAAYSLRLLDNTYTGDAIVVRRASDNTTQSIGFVNNELDTATLESFCSGTDGFVTTWYDQSGNLSHIYSAIASEQPQIVQNGTTIKENNKPSAYFDIGRKIWNNVGVDITGNQGWSSYFAYRQPTQQKTSTGDKAFAAFGEIGSGTCIRFTLEQPHSTSVGLGIRVNAGNSIYESNNISNTDLGLISWNLPDGHLDWGNYSDAFYNGNAQPQISSAASVPVNYVKKYVGIGAGVGSTGAFTPTQNYSADFFMSEMILFGVDTLSERTGIETNINSHYNIYP